MSFSRKYLYGLGLVSAACLGTLVACGETGVVDSDTTDYTVYNYVWSDKASFKVCNSLMNGHVAYHKTVGDTYICEYDKSSEEWAWVKHNEWNPNAVSSAAKRDDSEDEESSSSRKSEVESSSSAKLTPSKVKYGSFKDTRNKVEYKTVTIGGQLWMAENLNYETSTSYCYDAKEDNCDEYGRLYSWSDALSVCPEGWHLPSDSEWVELFDYVGSPAGKKLKSLNNWDEGAGTDQYGFGALPAGYKKGSVYAELGDYAGFWSSDYYDSGNAYSWRFTSTDNSEKKNSLAKTILRSVRCISDSLVASADGSSSSAADASSSSVKSSSSLDTDERYVNWIVEDAEELLDYPCSETFDGLVIYIRSDDVVVECLFDPDFDEYTWIESPYEFLIPSSSAVKSSSSATSSATVKSSSSATSSATVKSSSSVTSSTTAISSNSGPVSSAIPEGATTFKDTRDGHVYVTVEIGSQTWMAENLKYDPGKETLCYQDEDENCQIDGRLYSWNAAMTACPTGWHLPTADDWSTLISKVGSDNSAAILKANSTRWKEPGLDSYGFAVQPSGTGSVVASGMGVYSDPDDPGAYIWCATEKSDDATKANALLIMDSMAKASLGFMEKKLYVAVRCVMDD